MTMAGVTGTVSSFHFGFTQPKHHLFCICSKPDGMTWAEYLSTDPEPTCELQLAEENQREAITVTETAYWTVSEGSSPLYYYARQD